MHETDDRGSDHIRRLDARRVLVVMLVALLGGALLNAQAILRTAQQQRHGPGRSVAVAIAEPIAALSSSLQFDELRGAIDDALRREAPRPHVTAATPTTTALTPATPEPTTTAPPVAVTPTRPVTTTANASSTTTEPPTSTTTSPGLRSITAVEPLGLWVIGDSFIELFGPALVNRSEDAGAIEAAVDFRYVSGLTRPDFFEWPAYIAQELPSVAPDAVVVMFGGNDAQPVIIDGERVEVGEEAWLDLYTERVGEAMDVLAAGTERVYWIGLPIMESGAFTRTVQMLNAVYEAEAAGRSQITYLSTFELFADENGNYSAYLDGSLVRFTDGAHFTWNGAYRLADAVLDAIVAEWDIAGSNGP